MACMCCHLERIEATLQGIHAMLVADRAQHHQIIERLKTMANQIDKFRDDLRTNTDAVAARLDRALQQITTTGDNTASPETLADLQVISDHLKAMGTDPNNTLPELPPAPTV
jgi:ABC-type transporter Mla subunit MlaD